MPDRLSLVLPSAFHTLTTPGPADFALVTLSANASGYIHSLVLELSRPKGNDGTLWANDTITGEPYITYCILCSAGKACNSTGLTAPDVLCAEGYFCKLGAADPMPYCAAGEGLCTYGVCPVGHYCPTGTADPVVCPPGEWLALRESSTIYFGRHAEASVNEARDKFRCGEAVRHRPICCLNPDIDDTKCVVFYTVCKHFRTPNGSKSRPICLLPVSPESLPL